MKFSLWLQFITFNVLCLMGAGLCAALGWVRIIYNLDTTHLSSFIVLLFLGGLILGTYRMWQVTKLLDDRSADWVWQNRSNQSIELKLMLKIRSIGHLASVLMKLGLLGTVLGLVIGLLKPAVATDAAATAALLGGMQTGMGASLTVSLVALVLSIVTGHNYYMLRHATQLYYARLVK